MRVVLVGPPGAGKGTQAQFLTSHLSIPKISTGDIFRDNVSRSTPLGRRAQAYMERGDLVPDEITIAMVTDRLTDDDTSSGFLLDGFPRNVPQAETLKMVPRFLLMFLAQALTGGIRSPLLPAMLIPFSDLVIKSGWSRMSKTILVLIAGGFFAMAVLPARWFGPDVPQPAYWIILLGSLATAGVWHTRYALLLTRTIGDSACQLGRAREEMVYRALARAREMEHISAKLSHELKNPLAAIKGLVQLSARAACDPDSAEQLRVVAAEVDRMESILKEYLSFSRPFEALQPQPVALGALADEVLSLMDARAATAGVVLRRRGDATIEADPRRLKDALFNLVGNAVEATPQGGNVEVEIDEVDRAARIAVRDSGRGMPPEVLERLGTPFFTTRDEGTGLGVVVARSAFAQHGGSLVYSSEPGQGTTAVGTLPLKSNQRSSDGAGAAG